MRSAASAPPDGTPPPGNGTGGPPPDMTPPSASYTCSVSIGAPNLDVRARPGEYSAPVRQVVGNSGNLSFVNVTRGVAVARCRCRPRRRPLLPASATEVSTAGAGGGYTALVNGTAVAGDLMSDREDYLWLRLNLAPRGDAPGGVTVVQHVT